MNRSKTLSVEKTVFPLRLSPELYKKVRKKVNLKKEDIRGYSINEYLTELVMKDLGEKTSKIFK